MRARWHKNGPKLLGNPKERILSAPGVTGYTPGEEGESMGRLVLQLLIVVVILVAPQSGFAADEQGRELAWRWERAILGHRVDVVVSVPPQTKPGQRFPVLVALHGRGESKKGSARGARGWLDDYELSTALKRLANPPLTREDYRGYVRAARLKEVNERLAARPYAGVIVVCPYLPNIMKGEEAFEQTEDVARFIVDMLLPRVRRETPALMGAAATGIDGVSLGARAAVLVGLSRAKAFGVVAGLQLAIDESEIRQLTRLAKRARVSNPALQLRLLTSTRDYYLDVNKKLSRAWRRAGIAHSFRIAVGTHSYRFNRGPGALEMLLFHDQALRKSPH